MARSSVFKALSAVWLLAALLATGAGCDDPEQGGEARSVALPQHEKPGTPGSRPPPTVIIGSAPAANEALAEPVPPAVPGNSEALSVVAATPRGPVDGPVRATITFDRAVRALGKTAVDAAAPARIEPEVPGAWRWLGSATLEFDPEGPMPLATEFTVTVAAGLTALDGARLNTAFRFNFSTPPPHPVAGEPLNPWRASELVEPEQVFEVIFDQAPAAGEVQARVRIEGGPEPIGVEVVAARNMADPEVAPDGGVPDAGPALKTEAADRRASVKFKPARPLAVNTAYTLLIDAGLRGVQGTLPSASKVSWPFRTYGPLRVTALECSNWNAPCADGPFHLALTTPVTRAALERALTIEPPVKLAWYQDADSRSADWSLNGDFKPATAYTIRLTGLVDVFGQVLPEVHTANVKTGDLSPWLDTVEDGAVVEANLARALPLSHVNLASVKVGTALLDEPHAMARLREAWDKAEPPGFTWAPRALNGERNARRRSALDLSEVLTSKGQAALVRVAWQEGKDTHTTTTFVQATELALHTKVSPTDIHAWVWRMADGQPVAGAEVDVVDVTGKVLATARTGDDGIAKLPGVDTLPLPKISQWGGRLWDPPWFAVRARHDGDSVRVAANGDYRLSPYRFDVTTEWDNSVPVAQGLVFTDRGIYRPGEQVFVKGILRTRSQGHIALPEGRKVEVQLSDAKGAKISTQTVALTEFGGFSLPLTLPADGGLGSWAVVVNEPTAKLSWSASFQVAEYRAPAFLVDVTRAGGALIHGQPITGGVEGRYLFGAPMAGAETRWAVMSQATDFTPPDADGYGFGLQVPWWDEATSDNEVVARGEGVLDANGRLEVNAGPAQTEPDRPRAYTLEAQVTDVDRQAGGGRARFLAHPAAFYVGLRGPAGFATATEAFEVQVVARAADEAAAAVAAKGVAVKLFRKDWQTVKKQNVSGHFETVSELMEVEVEACALAVAAAAAGKCTFTAPTSGEHYLLAEATDAEGRLTRTRQPLWVVGAGYASWLKGDDNKVEVIVDKPRYEVGDTVKVLVQSPFAQSEAWLTVEREGLLWQKRIKLDGTAGAIDVTVTEEMIPNAFIGVVLARGRTGPPTVGDPERPDYRVGYRAIAVDPARKRLNVALKPDDDRKFPGDPLKIDVDVTDFAGKGAVAEVAVWAVDEGVLALTGYEAPDPLPALHGPRGLSVRQAASLSSLVAQIIEGDKGSAQGGGGGADDMETGNDVRRKFVTTPIFVGAAVTDAAGHVQVEGTLPDNLTTFRLMAVAITAGDQAGRGKSKVVVNKPLMVRPALPRVLRVGDRFAAGGVIHATSGETIDVVVTAELTGSARPVPDAVLTRKIAVPAGRGVEVRFPFMATSAGEAKFVLKVEGGGHRDIVEATLPVRTPNAAETLAIYGQTAREATEALALPAGIDPLKGSLELSLASTALSGLADQGQDLIDYPYGCLEQQTSRLIPLVAFKALLDQGKVDWMGDRDPKAVVGNAVKAIATMQRPDGGFGYWPGALRSHYWGTAWAVLGAGLARDAGHDIGHVDLARALKFLKTHLDRPIPGEYGGRTLEDQALGLYVLARHGQPDAEMTRRLYDQRAKLALFGKAMLAASFNPVAGPESVGVTGANADRAKTLLRELVNAARIDADRVHFAEVNPETYAARFSSDTRTTAMALLALLSVEPEHAYVVKVVRALLDARQQGAYENTQAAAWALLALHGYAQRFETTPPDFTAVVRLGGSAPRELARQVFDGASLSAHPAEVAMASLAAVQGERSLTFAVEGTGQLHYGARLSYVPLVMPTEPLEQGLVVQRWYTPGEGAVKGQVTSVDEGQLVRVHLRIANHQLRHYVAIEDPLPAGLEPVDPSLRTTARVAAPVDDDSGSEEADGHPTPLWVQVFDHKEIRDDRVLLFADHLPPGVHSFSYLARATTAGTFQRPPARAREMYHPEVNGRSSGGQFWVHPRTDLAGR